MIPSVEGHGWRHNFARGGQIAIKARQRYPDDRHPLLSIRTPRCIHEGFSAARLMLSQRLSDLRKFKVVRAMVTPDSRFGSAFESTGAIAADTGYDKGQRPESKSNEIAGVPRDPVSHCNAYPPTVHRHAQSLHLPSFWRRNQKSSSASNVPASVSGAL